jgi:hypothetical protein
LETDALRVAVDAAAKANAEAEKESRVVGRGDFDDTKPSSRTRKPSLSGVRKTLATPPTKRSV